MRGQIGQHKQAGILQAPPAMLESIYEWVVAIVAAQKEERLRDRLSTTILQVDACMELVDLIGRTENAVRAQIGLRKEFALYHELTNHQGYFIVYPGIYPSVTQTKFKELRESGDLIHILSELREDLIEKEKELSGSLRGIEAEIAKTKSERIPGVEATDRETWIPVDLAGWKYGAKFSPKMDAHRESLMDTLPDKKIWDKVQSGSPGMPTFEEIKKSMEETWRKIRVKIEKTDSRNLASWKPALRILYIHDFPYVIDDAYLTKLRAYIRHELQHMAQAFMSEALNSVPAGLPSVKSRTPDFDQQMNRNHQDKIKAISRLKQKGVNVSNLTSEDFYYMDDIEYMTQLADAIEDFQRLESRGIVGERKSAIRVFTGQGGIYDKELNQGVKLNPFFASLGKLGGRKYKSAVREFVKTILK